MLYYILASFIEKIERKNLKYLSNSGKLLSNLYHKDSFKIYKLYDWCRLDIMESDFFLLK